MVFSSPVFIFLFLPIVYLSNILIPKRFSNVLLLIFSLLFYAWGEPFYLFLMLLSGIINYGLARWIDATTRRKGFYLILAVVFNIGVLGVFKYADFLILTINSLLNSSLTLVELPLPIGISFYTFQSLSYVIDVYKNESKVQTNFFSLLLYISFFPQLIAGPIVKYHDIANQIKNRSVTINNTASGLKRFVIGLSKKVLLANAWALVVDTLYALPNSEISTIVVWVAAVGYVFQIYFDFSGYSDMAIGLGRMFGFHFKENFNYPLTAVSIQDFWRRWHISLSTWFKLYVYIPLGGNRHGQARAVANRIFVFFLTGLWHGASWTFVVWGLYHGMFLLLEQLVFNVKKWPRFIQHTYTLLVVLFGFVLFRAENFTQALFFFQSMFNFSLLTPVAASQLSLWLTPSMIFLLVVSIIAVTPWIKTRTIKYQSTAMQGVSMGVLFVLWIACLLSLSANTYNPFIYFRF